MGKIAVLNGADDPFVSAEQIKALPVKWRPADVIFS
jgi:hypothetical protein